MDKKTLYLYTLDVNNKQIIMKAIECDDLGDAYRNPTTFSKIYKAEQYDDKLMTIGKYNAGRKSMYLLTPTEEEYFKEQALKYELDKKNKYESIIKESFDSIEAINKSITRLFIPSTEEYFITRTIMTKNGTYLDAGTRVKFVDKLGNNQAVIEHENSCYIVPQDALGF